MHFEFGFYSSFLLISFSQGLIFSLLLLKKGIQDGNTANYWLSGFVFLCCLYIAPWMLGFAGWYDHQPYRDILFYTPFQHLFFLGPLMYFYSRRLLNPGFRFQKKSLLHFVPGLVYLIATLYMWIYDKFLLGKAYYYADGMDKDFDQWYQITGLVAMVVYFVLSIHYYNTYKSLLFQVVSNAEQLSFKWIKNFLYAFLVMLVLPVVFDVAAYFYPELESYTGNWWFFLCFSLVMYYIALSGYGNAMETKMRFTTSGFESQPILLLTQNQTDDEQAVTIDIAYEDVASEPSVEVMAWKQKIDTLIQTEKLYENPELSLSDISKKLQTNPSVVSKAINQGFRLNFNDCINHYRVQAVKSRLVDNAQHKQTLLGIAYDCGFNSKATFNRAFKKSTGLSPKDYLQAGQTP